MFCPKCGKQMIDEAVFCSNCGFKLPTDDISASDIKETVVDIETGESESHDVTAARTANGSIKKIIVISVISIIGAAFIGEFAYGLSTNKYAFSTHKKDDAGENDISIVSTVEKKADYWIDDNEFVLFTENGQFTCEIISSNSEYADKNTEGIGAIRLKKYEGSDTYINIQQLSNSVYELTGEHHNITHIQSGCFKNSTIVEIEAEGIREISSTAFDNCEKLESVFFPNVTEVKKSTFKYCSALKSAEFSSAEKISDEAFMNCSNLENVLLPNAVELGKCVFKDCTVLKSIELPFSEIVSDEAFMNCSNLENVILPNTAELGKSAFKNCTALKSIELPSIEKIPDEAFYGCSSLETIPAPKAVDVGVSAFLGCESIRDFTLSNAEIISNDAFNGCAALKTVDLPEAKQIGSRAFYNCSDLTKVQLSSNIQFVEVNAFADTNVSEVTYSEGVKPKNVLFSPTAFKNTPYEKQAKVIETPNGKIYYDLDDDCLILTEYSGSDTYLDLSVIRVAGSYNNVKIGDYCFADSSLEKIDLQSVDSVGVGAFKNCSRLTEASYLCSDLGDYAFSGCTNLTDISFSFIGDKLCIGKCCFENSGLTNVACSGISDYGISIGDNAFKSTPWEEKTLSSDNSFDKFGALIYPERYRGKAYELELDIKSLDYGGMQAAYNSDDNYDLLDFNFERAAFPFFEQVDVDNNKSKLNVTCIYNGVTSSIADPNTLWFTSVPCLEITAVENEENLARYDDIEYLSLQELYESIAADESAEETYIGEYFCFDVDIIAYQGPFVWYGFGSIAGKLAGSDVYISCDYVDSDVECSLDGRVTVYGRFDGVTSSPYFYKNGQWDNQDDMEAFLFTADRITDLKYRHP